MSTFDLSVSLYQICEILGCDSPAAEGKNVLFRHFRHIEEAQAEDISFLDSEKLRNFQGPVQAGVCFVRSGDAAKIGPATIPVIVEDPWKAFVTVLRSFFPVHSYKPPFKHETCVIHKESIVDPSCYIGANVVVLDHVVIEPHCVLEDGAVIGPYVHLEEKCILGAQSTVSHAHFEESVVVKPGARIGQIGFGFLIEQEGPVDVPHIGSVYIGCQTAIGANTTIDRGVLGTTKIGRFCRIDNLVQIGHNCQIGDGSVIAAQTGLSGSCILGKGCALGGQVGLAPHVSLGDRTQVAAKSGVMRSSDAFSQLGGIPAVPIGQWRRQVAQLGYLCKKSKEKGDER